MSSRAKPLIVNSLLSSLSILLTLFIAETFVRFAIGKDLPLNEGHHQLFCEHDPFLGWRKIPDASGTHRTPEYTVVETFNSKGLRGPEYPYDKHDREHRILILGDSFAEGYTVSFEELFSEVLERRLSTEGGQGPPVRHEVINAGTGGYSTDQELLFFEQEGKKYQPDWTVLLFYHNDLWFNAEAHYWRGKKPLFELRDGRLVLTNVPLPEPAPESARGALHSMKRWSAKHSYLYRLVRQRVKDSPAPYSLAVWLGIADPLERAPSEEKAASGNAAPIPRGFRIFRKRLDAKHRALWKLTEALLEKLEEQATMAGSRLLVFYVPFRASIYRDEWKAIKDRYGMSDAEWSAEQPGILLEELCRRQGIDFLDPTERFRAEAKRRSMQGERLYFAKDGHWNAAGHELVGEILAEDFRGRFPSVQR